MNPAEFANIAASEQTFWWYRGMREILHDQLDRFASSADIRTVLDAGCGTGANAEDLRRHYGWNVIGLDASPVSMGWLRRRGLPALHADITRIPLAPASCDAVISCDVLIHLEPGAEVNAFAEFTRVLRPGGLLVLRVAAFNWLRSRHSIFIDERQRFTRRQILELATASGLTPISSTYLNGIALPLALAKFRVWEPLFDQRPSSAVGAIPAWLDSLLLSALRTERAWLKRGHALPVGQTIFLAATKPELL